MSRRKENRERQINKKCFCKNLLERKGDREKEIEVEIREWVKEEGEIETDKECRCFLEREIKRER